MNAFKYDVVSIIVDRADDASDAVKVNIIKEKQITIINAHQYD